MLKLKTHYKSLIITFLWTTLTHFTMSLQSPRLKNHLPTWRVKSRKQSKRLKSSSLSGCYKTKTSALSLKTSLIGCALIIRIWTQLITCLHASAAGRCATQKPVKFTIRNSGCLTKERIRCGKSSMLSRFSGL